MSGELRTKVALIGAGYWGKNLARNFHALGALAAIVDFSESVRAERAAQYPGLPVHDSLDPVWNDPGIGAVAIATPAETHSDLVQRALLAGKHVFVEKPLCLDVQAGMQLVGLAEQKGLTLMVGHLLHYHPAVERLKEMVDGGQLGRLQYIYSNRLNLGKIRREENILWSFAPHDVSVILALTGEMPSAITCTGGYYLQPNIADVTLSHLDFPSGVKAHIFVSWLHPFKEQKLVLVGTEGMAVFDDTVPERKLLFYQHRVRWEKHLPVPDKQEAQVIELAKAEPLRQECQHFLECVQTGLKPLTDGREGLRVLSVLDSCQQSLNTGGGLVKAGMDHLGLLQDQGFSMHPTAEVDQGVSIGQGTKIWHFSHVLAGSRIGDKCNVGQNVVIGPKAVVGNGCKIQNNVSVYQGVILEDHVFCGPSMVFTNVINPRAHIVRKDEYRNTLVKEGATLGANSTIVCGHTIGRYAMVGAGAVITKDVPDHALMVGNPARQMGWVCACGVRLPEFDAQGRAACGSCGQHYLHQDGLVRPE